MPLIPKEVDKTPVDVGQKKNRSFDFSRLYRGFKEGLHHEETTVPSCGTNGANPIFSESVPLAEQRGHYDTHARPLEPLPDTTMESHTRTSVGAAYSLPLPSADFGVSSATTLEGGDLQLLLAEKEQKLRANDQAYRHCINGTVAHNPEGVYIVPDHSRQFSAKAEVNFNDSRDERTFKQQPDNSDKGCSITEELVHVRALRDDLTAELKTQRRHIRTTETRLSEILLKETHLLLDLDESKYDTTAHTSAVRPDVDVGRPIRVGRKEDIEDTLSCIEDQLDSIRAEKTSLRQDFEKYEYRDRDIARGIMKHLDTLSSVENDLTEKRETAHYRLFKLEQSRTRERHTKRKRNQEEDDRNCGHCEPAHCTHTHLKETSHCRATRGALQSQTCTSTADRPTCDSRTSVTATQLPVFTKPDDKPSINDSLSIQEDARQWLFQAGTQVLSNMLGLEQMKPIFAQSGMKTYAETSGGDADLYASFVAALERTLRDRFPTRIDPYTVVIEGLAGDENPHAYVNRVHQLWLDLTGNDGSQSDTDRSFLRTKLESGLPHAVQKKLRDVVGLATMPLHAYREQIIHFVNQHRHKLMNDQAKAIDMVQHLSGQKSLLNEAKLADIAVAKQLALARPAYTPNPVPLQPPQTLPWRVRESPNSPQWGAPAQGQQATTMLPPPQAMPRHQWAPQPAQQSQQYTAPPERYANCHRCGLPGHFRRHCNQTFPAPRENKTVSTQGGDVMDIR